MRYLTILLLFLLISCKKEPITEPKNELYSEWKNYFDTIDYETPVNHYSNVSMVKLVDHELVFSAFNRLDYSTTGKFSLFTLSNNKVVPIDSSQFFTGYTHLYLNENGIEKHIYTNQDYLFVYDKNISYLSEWYITNLHDTHHSARGQIDKPGNIWITSNTIVMDDGLHMYNGNTWKTWFEGTTFWSVCFDRNGILYASTLPHMEEHGIIMRYDYTKWDTVIICSGSAKWVSCMSFDKENNLWLGVLSRWAVGPVSGDGVYKFDGKNVTNYSIYNSKLPCNSVVDIAIDEADNKWIGTYSGGMAKLSPDGNWKVYNKGNTPLPINSVDQIIVDTRMNIWTASSYFGVSRIKE